MAEAGSAGDGAVTASAECDPQEATAPYPGLRPFEPHEWNIFFGRELIAVDVIGENG